MNNTISENLAFYRRKRNLTQKELAKKTGLSISFISHIENKVSEPSDENLKKIADALGVSVSDLRVDENLKKLKNEDIELLKLLIKLTLNLKIEWGFTVDNYGDCYYTNINDVDYRIRYRLNNSGDIYYIYLSIVSELTSKPIMIDSENNNNYDYLFELVQTITNLERDKNPVFKYLKDLENLDLEDE